MARINDNLLFNWQDGDVVDAQKYKQEREIIRTAVNDNNDRLTNQEEDHKGTWRGFEPLEVAEGINSQRIDNIPQRNVLINGAFDIWQRGTSGSNVSGFGPDRWVLSGTNNNYQRVEGGTPSGVLSGQYLSLSRTSGTVAGILQRVESSNARSLIGKPATLSLWARRPVGGMPNLEIVLATPTTKDNHATTTTFHTEVKPFSSNGWEKFVFKIPQIGSEAANGLSVLIRGRDGGTLPLNIDFAEVKLEPGDVVTPFDHQSIGQVLRDCQRYFSKSYASNISPGTNTSLGVLEWAMVSAVASHNSLNIRFPVEKRAQPTVTLYSTTGTINTIRNTNASADIPGSAVNIASSGCLVRANNNTDISTAHKLGTHYVADAEL